MIKVNNKHFLAFLLLVSLLLFFVVFVILFSTLVYPLKYSLVKFTIREFQSNIGSIEY